MLNKKISVNSANPFPHANCSKICLTFDKNSKDVHHYNGI
jgi:hypothetical protein